MKINLYSFVNLEHKYDPGEMNYIHKIIKTSDQIIWFAPLQGIKIKCKQIPHFIKTSTLQKYKSIHIENLYACTKRLMMLTYNKGAIITIYIELL